MKFLRAVVTLPYCTPDGRTVTKLGYDEDTQLYLHLSPDYVPRVPAAPTEQELKAALQTLAGPWAAFSFATPDDAAGMLSAVLTAVFRPALSLSPGFMFDAACQASGKTLAATALGCVVTGRRVGVTPFAGDGSGSDDEVRKRLFASALSGDLFTCWDNCTGHMKSAALAGFLTSGSVSDRVLGKSANETAECRVLVTATANQASLDADLGRRLLRVRIDAGANPAARRFAFDPCERALRDRVAIAEAACTLVAGWRAAGSPRIASADCGGYGQWVALCRQPVMWAAECGLTDCLGWGQLGDPAASLLQNPALFDYELESLSELLRGLNALSDGVAFTSADVLTWYRHGDGDDGAFGLVREAVRDLLGPRAGSEPSSKSIGRLLRNRRDRHVNGLKLLSRSTATANACHWSVVRTEV